VFLRPSTIPHFPLQFRLCWNLISIFNLKIHWNELSFMLVKFTMWPKICVQPCAHILHKESYKMVFEHVHLRNSWVVIHNYFGYVWKWTKSHSFLAYTCFYNYMSSYPCQIFYYELHINSSITLYAFNFIVHF